MKTSLAIWAFYLCGLGFGCVIDHTKINILEVSIIGFFIGFGIGYIGEKLEEKR